MNTVQLLGLRFKGIGPCKAMYVCKEVSNSPVGKNRYRGEKPTWNTRAVMPCHAGKPRCVGEGGGSGQVKSEGRTQINSR